MIDIAEIVEERAAIMEYDAGMPRESAERHALMEIQAKHGYPARKAAYEHLQRKKEAG